jgi:hypothetical protein
VQIDTAATALAMPSPRKEAILPPPPYACLSWGVMAAYFGVFAEVG